VEDYRSGQAFYYLRIRALIKDGSTLFVRQFVSRDDYHYSFHWQRRDGALLARWDNAPHHPGPTFPHHRHLPDGTVEPSTVTTLQAALEGVEQALVGPEKPG